MGMAIAMGTMALTTRSVLHYRQFEGQNVGCLKTGVAANCLKRRGREAGEAYLGACNASYLFGHILTFMKSPYNYLPLPI